MSERMRFGARTAALLIVLTVLPPLGGVIRRLPIVLSRSSVDVPLTGWLIAGPFAGSGQNALFRDYLKVAGGEAALRAREGDLADWGLGRSVRWRPATPDNDGIIDFRKIFPDKFRSIAYAYTEIVSDEDRYAVATIGSGIYVQVRLNGEIVHETRIFRATVRDEDTVLLPLRKGTNRVLVKVEHMGLAWKVQWTTHFPTAGFFVNEKKNVIPDFRVGEPVDAWGQIEVANVSNGALADVRVEVVEDLNVLPTRSDSITLGAGDVRFVPFRIRTRKAVAESQDAPLRIRISSGPELCEFEAKPRIRKPGEYFVATYRSAVDGSVQPYSILLPGSFDPTRTYSLIVLLHGSHVTTWGRNIESYEPKEWAIQMAPHDRGNNDYRDIGEVDLYEAMRELSEHYRVDPDRTHLSGHSMGGYGVWFQATRHPDKWASISPQTATTDLSIDNPTLLGADNVRQLIFQRQLIESWSPITFAENLLHVPAYVMHGARDEKLSVEHARRMTARLAHLGYSYVYDEVSGEGHWWGEKGNGYGVDCVDKKEISDFFLQHSVRVRSPRRVVYKTDDLRYRQAYWVAIDELERANRLASIEAEVGASNEITVKTENVAQLRLNLDDRIVAMNEPVTVAINGKLVFSGPAPSGRVITLRHRADGRYSQILERAAGRDAGSGHAADRRRVEALLDEEGKIERLMPATDEAPKKSGLLYGPIVGAFDRPFLFVLGTQGSDSRSQLVNAAARDAAQSLARDWMARANGIVQIKSDTDVTDEEIGSRNLFLFGSVETNSIIARINDRLPIRFSKAELLVGKRTVSGSDLGLIAISPNPLNPLRYVVIVGGLTAESFRTAARLRLTDLPDYVVFDRWTLQGERVNLKEGGFFDNAWQVVHQE
jgi:pimeloyl-ACP methyl ester carboxylesterase